MIHAGGASLDVLSAAFAAALGAALLAGTVRGFSGFGSALILSPLLSALYDPATAVPVALLLELALAVPFVPPALRLADRARVALLCVAAAITVPAGAWLLVAVDEEALRWAICALVLTAVGILGFGWRHHGRPRPAATAATGALSGLLGGSTGLSGPPVIFYELSGTAPIPRVRANFMVFFAWIDVVALVAFAITGTLAGLPLVLSAVLVIPYLAAAAAGARAFRRAGEAFYRRLALAVLVCVAVVSLPL
ncbi:MAG TPA: sulfite exporter TauE/SafE family protein [Solirubrobacteraceae bacterium]|nr:sulfite exporter TauE/SafE family protein [Solirubrobacteraceae bacterium]